MRDGLGGVAVGRERAGPGRSLAGNWVVFDGLRVDLNGDNGEKRWLFSGSFSIIAS